MQKLLETGSQHFRRNMYYDYDIDDAIHMLNIMKSDGSFLYKNVIVIFDEDKDLRIFDFIDRLPEYARQQILFLRETQANVDIFWKSSGKLYTKKIQDIDIGGDTWTITHHVVE